MRHLADSRALLVLTLVFLGVIVHAFRPGSRPLHDLAATVIFRHEDAPAKGGGKAIKSLKSGPHIKLNPARPGMNGTAFRT